PHGKAMNPLAASGPLREAVEKARHALLQSQRGDGSWECPCDTGPVGTAHLLVALHFLGRLDARDAAEGARWLCGQQRDDGSVGNYPHARQGQVGATASALAAWRVAGVPEGAAPVRRARAFLENNGGVGRVIEAMKEGDVAAIFLALAGLVEPSKLP